MNPDPIVEELHKHRQEHAAKYENDLDKICEALRRLQAQSQRQVVERSPRPRLAKTAG